MADLINIGISGLKTHQIGLSVTGNNVANINTPGYSRQEAIFVDKPSLETGAGFIGQGSSVETIRRIASSFIIEQQRADTTVFHEREALLAQAEAIDNLLASSSTGLTPSLSRFFEAFQSSSEDPTSVPQRQLLLTQTEGLVTRFTSLDDRFDSLLKNINQNVEADISSINSLAQGLADTNAAIALASSGSGQNQEPNQLLDERDELLRQLAEYVQIGVVEEPTTGAVNVYIGKGEPLVLGNDANPITAIRNPEDGTLTDVAMVINGVHQNITPSLTGGSLGGILRFRDDELAGMMNALGRIALTIADSVNQQHALGMDLDGNLGGLYFGDINDDQIARSRVIANAGNEAPFDQSLRINITDTSALTIDNYELRFEGPGAREFIIVNKTQGDIVYKSTLSNVYPTRIQLDGFELQFDAGTFKEGDRFTLYPTKTGAADFSQEIDRVQEIALAAPIRARTSLGNIGDASISLGTMLDVQSPLTNQTLPAFAVPGQLSPPLLVRFIDDNYYEVLDNSDPANPQALTPPMNNQLYEQGLNNPLFADDPGATSVSALGSDTQVVPAPGGGPFTNGYGAQNLTFQIRDPETGVIVQQGVSIAANTSAKDISTSLTAIPGVEASAYTHIRLSNFVDDADPTPLGLQINGEVIAVTPPALFEPAELVDVINNNAALQGLSIYAVSDGTNLDIRSFTGEDIEVLVTGAGDSIDVSRVDPYAAGSPVISTQTVTSGQGVAVGGNIDITMSDGISIRADVESVFQTAPPSQSAYLGFQFEIQGQARRGDEFTIEYNEGGVSDNRNGLAMAALESKGIIDGGLVSYGESYAQIVEKIGTVTNRARLETESARALLDQSTNIRDSISAVNLDEEAGKLVQYQAAYNASAQVVAVARELFDTLLGAFR